MSLEDERDELRRSVRRFFEARSPEAEVRRLMDTAEGYDPTVWAQMAEQLGLQGLAIPEAYGGLGFGYEELVIALEEMGRALVCAPFFGSVVLAANLLLASGDEDAKQQYLPGIAAGTTIATVALCEQDGRWVEDAVTLRATLVGDDWHLDGTKWFVLDGSVADLVLVVARSEAGVSLFAVDRGAEGLTNAALETMDQTRKLARLDFDDTPARLVGGNGDGWAAVETMLDRGAIALAAEQAGAAGAVLDFTVEYVKARYAFGRAIGSFQAVKHQCAEILRRTESAKAAAAFAGRAVSSDDEEVPVLAHLVKSYCSDALLFATTESIQLHGGIGFTWEHPAHLYFRRAQSSKVLLGTPRYHEELLADCIGI